MAAKVTGTAYRPSTFLRGAFYLVPVTQYHYPRAFALFSLKPFSFLSISFKSEILRQTLSDDAIMHNVQARLNHCCGHACVEVPISTSFMLTGFATLFSTIACRTWRNEEAYRLNHKLELLDY